MEECASTQDLVRQWIDNNHTSHIAYLAHRQTQGRGRSGHSWHSPEGGLYLSLAIPTATYPPLWFPLLCGLSLSRLLEEKGVKPMLKWPNDCLIQEKKVAGILCEIYRGQMIAGVGINLHTPLEALPPDLREKTTSLHLHGIFVKREALAHAFLESLHLQSALPLTQLREEWQKRDALYGKSVLAQLGKETLVGTALGIDEEGSLILDVDEKKFHLKAGEVTLSSERRANQEQ